MKRSALLYALLGICFGCATPGQIIEAREKFLEVRTPIDAVRAVCESTDEPDTNFFGVYAVFDGILFDFSFRRVQDAETCALRIKEFQKLIADSRYLRLVGHDPSKNQIEKKYAAQYPKDLGNFDFEINAVFVNIWNDRGNCMSFFENDCDPADRWAGVIPGKKITFK